MTSLSLKPLPALSKLEWYNLQTSRKNSSPRVDDRIFIVDQYKVGGTLEEIYEFCLINGYDYSSLRSNSKPLPPINRIDQDPCPESLDQLSQAQIDSLEVFNLCGYTAPARVKRVLDGDTIELVLYFDLKYLKQLHPGNHRKGIGIGEGIYMCLRIRLYGINAAEKTTADGQAANRILSTTLELLGNKIYLRCFGYDKYGRTLGIIYRDPEYKVSINKELLAHTNSFKEYFP